MYRKRRAQTAQTMLLCCVLFLAFATSATAQTVINTPTTTTLWAGTADWQHDGLSSVTAPASGVILSGTAINPNTGKPFRHLWYGDASNGLCRIDPDIDTPPAPVAGIGNHNNIQRTCIGTVQKPGFTPGQLAFDPATNTLYAVNTGRQNAGVVRFHYIPSGDSGHGQVDPVHVESLMGIQGTRNSIGGCPTIGDPNFSGNPIPQTPGALSLGPDGNLYVGYFRDGAIIRILTPATFDPSTNDCQNKLQVPLFSADERVSQGHTFGLGWIGHDLYGADNIAPWILTKADQCLTPANGNKRCPPAQGTEILGAFIAGPQGGLVTDQIFSGPNAFPGNNFYAATLSDVTRVTNLTSVANMTLDPQYGGSFSIIGMTLDTADLANETLYIGSDPTGGGINGAGAIFQVTQGAPPPAPPLPPINVIAANATPPGASEGSASVSWTPQFNGQPTTSYVVRTVLASDGTTQAVSDVTVEPTPPSTVVPVNTTITGLTVGTAVEFLAEACNDNGCSAFSAVSAPLTPIVPTVPGAPTGVSAVPAVSAASVAWTVPPSGGSPILNYTVTVTDTGTSTTTKTTVPAPSSGTQITGLVNGDSYSITVHATNAVGSSSESTPPATVTLPVQTLADVAVAVSAPGSVTNSPQGVQVTYSVTVTNNGPAAAPQVVLNASPSLPGALVSDVSSQGSCGGAIGGTSLSCNLGSLAAGTSASLTVVVGFPSTATGNVTGTFSGVVNDPAGKVTDPTAANNTASAITSISAGGGGGGGTSADIQVGGSAQNGGPAVNSADTFTWQIKDNTGNTAAPSVVFTTTLPSSFQFSSAASAQGTCSGIAAGSFGGTLTCSLGNIAGGQTAIVTVNVVPTQAGTFPTTGSATFSGTDTNPANNSFTVTINPK